MIYDDKDFSVTLPGDVFMVQTHMPGKLTIKAGQTLIGDDCRFHHTGIAIGDDALWEARPPRSRIVAINPEVSSLWYRLPLTDLQRDFIYWDSREQFKRGEVKYQWSAYLTMGLLHYGITPDAMRNRIEKSKRRVCSQLTDEVLFRAGYHLFNDGRKQFDVSPGDIEWRLAHDKNVIPFRLDGKNPYDWSAR